MKVEVILKFDKKYIRALSQILSSFNGNLDIKSVISQTLERLLEGRAKVVSLELLGNEVQWLKVMRSGLKQMKFWEEDDEIE